MYNKPRLNLKVFYDKRCNDRTQVILEWIFLHPRHQNDPCEFRQRGICDSSQALLTNVVAQNEKKWNSLMQMHFLAPGGLGTVAEMGSQRRELFSRICTINNNSKVA
jgi:hypothetical protein